MKQKIKIGTPLCVLFLEDTPKDAEVCRELIIDSGYNLSMDITATEKEFESFLLTRKYDVILSDFKLPGFDAFGALRLCNKICPDVPFICVSGAIGEETAVELLKLGAVDYILKDRLERLPFAIKKAIENEKEKESRQKAEILLAASEMQYRRLFESARDGILILDEETGKIIDVNPFLIELLGYTKEEFLEKEIWEIGFFKNIVANRDKFLELLHKEYVHYEDLPIETSDGRQIDVEFVSNVYPVNSHKVIQCNIRDITKRKQAEQKMIQLSALVESSDDIIISKTLDGKITSWNKGAEKIYGYNESEVIGQPISLLIPPGHKDEMPEILEKIKYRLSVDNFESERVAKDGRIIQVSLTISSIKTGDDKIIGVSTIGHDITERKLAEEKLLESNERFRHSFDYAPSGSCIVSIEGKFQKVNKVFTKMIGYEEDELKNFTFSDITHPDDLSIGLSQLQKMLSGESESASFEKRYIRKDTQIIWVYVSISLVRNANLQPQYFISQIIDITERKLANEKIKMFSTAVESAYDCFVLTDMNGNVTYVNESSIKIFGYSPAELMKFNVGQFCANPEDAAKIIEELKTKELWSGELTCIKKNKETFIVILSVSLIKDAKSNPTGMMGIFRDITERKKLETDLSAGAEIAKLGYWEYDINSGNFILNDQYYRIIHGSSTEKQGGNIMRAEEVLRRLVHPDDSVMIGNKLQEAISSPDPEYFGITESRVFRDNGDISNVMIQHKVVKDDTGQTIKVVGVVQDITEQKHAEEKLRESEAMLLRSQEIGHLGSFEWDIVTNKIVWSAETFRLYGYQPNEIDPDFELVLKNMSDESREEFNQSIEAALKGEKLHELDYTFFTKNKDKRILHSIGDIKRDKEGNPLKMFGVVIDITERKKLEKDLSAAAEIAKLGYWEYDVDAGQFIFNDQYYRLIHGSSTKKQGGNIMSAEEFAKRLVHPEDANIVGKSLQAAISSPDPNYLGKDDARVFCDDGTVTNVSVQFKVLKDSSGRTYKVYGVNQDITEQKQAEEKIRNLAKFPSENPFPILRVDKNGTLLYVNESGQKQLQEWNLQIEHSVPNMLKEVVLNTLNSGKIQQVEFNHSEKTYLFYITPIFGTEYANLYGWDITERKLAEEELRKSREDLFKFIEDDISADFITTPLGKILQCNRTFLKLFGFKSKEEALTFPIEKLYPVPSDRNRFIELIKKNKKIENFEGELVSLDGRIIYTLENTIAEFNNANELIQIRGYIVDITKRKKAEEELKKLSRAVEQSPASVIITTQDGDIEYVNKKFCKVTGYSKEEVFGKNPRILKSGQQDKIFYEGLWNDILEGKDWKGEIRNKKKNGELFWESVSISPLVNNEGDITNFVAVKEDITERKQAEEEIVMLANALKSVSECVSITDIEDKIIFVNQSFAKTYGYSEAELIGKHISNFRSPNNPQKLVDEILPSSFRGGWQGELWTKRKDGSEFLIYLSTRIINDKDGKPFGLIGIASDITERKAAEKEFIKAKELADQSNKLKDAFIANISHEIRTPLNGILGLTSIIKDMYAEHMKEGDEELFAGIDHSSKRIIRTVDLILNYSRMQAGEFPINPKEIEISLICENLVNEFTTAAKSKSLELSFENKCGKTTTIFGDEYSTTQAISNLIDNAIKYTNKGFVDVILYNENNDEILLDVKDSGIGISEDYIQHIFEPYTQEQIGYGRAYQGVGLGLSMVKKFLNLNNANISVESKKGKGTTFTINFEKSLQKSAGRIIEEKIDRIIGKPVTQNKLLVLIVEDDVFNQITIKRFIEDSYNTINSDSSEGAIELLKDNKVDLILMDISIKGSKNGLELTEELKASKEYSHIPVIAITAHAFDTDRQNALKAGCADYLSKPFSKNLLLDTIGKFV